MDKAINLRGGIVAAAIAVLALVLSACSDNNANKNATPVASTNTSPNAPAPAANTNSSLNPVPAANTNTSTAAASNANAAQAHTFVIDTTMGKIKIELLDKDAPVTAENFRKLANSGFYNGLVFHRTINGFMIQGGDPQGTGMGGRTADGKVLPNEIKASSPLYQSGYHRGVVAMANSGTPETAKSQFFIMQRDLPLAKLPANYTIFARVIEGMDVVDKIASAPTPPGSDHPNNPVKMTKVAAQ